MGWNNDCIFCGYSLHLNPTRRELLESYRLRARVFCNELRWTPSQQGIDIDAFDSVAEHVVVNGPDGRVCATARMILGSQRWMLDDVFPELVPAGFSPEWKLRSAEVSRFAVDQEYRCRKSGPWMLADVLMKGLYLGCRESSVECIQMITSTSMRRFLLSRGYPIRTIGPEKRMPDGVTAVMCLIRWSDLHLATRANARRLSRWLFEHDHNSPALSATETAW